MWPKTEKTRRLSFGREDLAAVLTADRLQPAERRLVEALYTRAEQVRGLATFGAAFSSHVVDGRLHGQLHAGGAVTGRYTSTDPNLQNIPTDPEFRGFFRAPEGRVLVDVDYSQLELRVFAALSGDAKMIAAFEDGWDYHDLIVQRLGCTRRQAKAVNFGIIFGMSVATLAAELGVDDVTAGEYLRGWDEQAPTGAEWRSELPRLYVAEQGVRTARRWIDYLDDDDADATANTRPMNYPVQGGAADVMHRAMRAPVRALSRLAGQCAAGVDRARRGSCRGGRAAPIKLAPCWPMSWLRLSAMCCRTGRRGSWPFLASVQPGRRQRPTVRRGKRRCGRATTVGFAPKRLTCGSLEPTQGEILKPKFGLRFSSRRLFSTASPDRDSLPSSVHR